MRFTRQYILLLASWMLASSPLYGQGTPAFLRCMFRGTVEVRSRPEASSPIVARVACGESVVLLDRQYRTPHVLTTSGKHGYITGFNGGQWTVDTELEAISSRPVSLAMPANAAIMPSRSEPADFELSKDGVGPIRITAKVDVNNSRATLNFTARNDSGEDIQSTKFCVSPMGSRECTFELRTSAVWQVGEELTWTLNGRASPGIDMPAVTLVELRKVPPRILSRANAARTGSSELNISRSDATKAETVSRGPVLEAVLQGLVAGLSNPAPTAQSEKFKVFGGRNLTTYLGCLNCSEDVKESVFNPDGKGSSSSSESIWNRSSEFASENSSYSVCNPHASDPPIILRESGNLYGRLTLNTYHPQLGSGSEWIGWLLNAVCK